MASRPDANLTDSLNGDLDSEYQDEISQSIDSDKKYDHDGVSEIQNSLAELEESAALLAVSKKSVREPKNSTRVSSTLLMKYRTFLYLSRRLPPRPRKFLQPAMRHLS